MTDSRAVPVPERSWHRRAGTVFTTENSAVTGTQGVVAANHPLASAAGLQVLAEGGTAVDAAVCSLFTLGVVEPMMVGLFGAGWTNIQLTDGTSIVLDNYSVAPAAATPDLFTPVSDNWPGYMDTVERENQVGYRAVGVPGTLRAWAELADQYGTMDWELLLRPAIDLAQRGFRTSEYLHRIVSAHRDDLAACPHTAAVFLRDGAPVAPGEVLRQPELAETLRTIATEGAASLYGGSLGQAIIDEVARHDGIMTLEDLRNYRTVRRPALTRRYRGYDVTVPPPPCSGGLHILQILALLEDFDVAEIGFGTVDGLHLLAECFRIAFADRTAHVGDPDVAPVPVDWLLSTQHADQRRAGIDLSRAGSPGPLAPPSAESATTTHITTADADGTIVTMTQTLNHVFGAKVMPAGTGLLLNNTMSMFDPHPGHPNSVGSGKRMVSSMSPTIINRDGRPFLAIGTPGGVRIFPALLQAIVNVLDHGMTLQEAVEAPRVWTQGQHLEAESAFDESVIAGLAARGHDVRVVNNIAGGMNAIGFDGSVMTGSSCWRGDGAPAALGGGQARARTTFHTTAGPALH